MVLDLACTFICVPTKTDLQHMEEFSRGGAIMGNNVPCKIVRVGTIKIRMFADAIVTLTDVRHILELK